MCRFREHLPHELDRLAWDLKHQTVDVGRYRFFTIRDPKERTICAAPFRERVLHHALVAVCEPAFEAYQISESYACRKGRGVHRALERLRCFTTSRRYFLKLDVRKYFDHISHLTLQRLLERRFKDERLLALLWKIVQSHEAAPGRGVPIGNLTSQYFANHYLAPLDHFVKEQLRVRAYVRYMDDLVLWGDDRDEVRSWLVALRQFAHDTLQLEFKPPLVNRCSEGLPVLGYRVSPRGTRLSRRSRVRFRRKLTTCARALAAGRITEEEASRRTLPLLAFVRHAETYGLRKRILGVASEARTG